MRGKGTLVDSLSEGEEGDSGVVSSSRAGYLPIPLLRVPLAVLNQIPVYLKARQAVDGVPQAGDKFSLYASGVVPFTEADRNRLRENGVRFIYVRIADQPRLQRQLEASLIGVAADQETPAPEAAGLIYETSYELVNEVLAEPGLQCVPGSIRDVSLAVSTFVLNHKSAFSHLFAAARHDLCIATHLVNVATWMVPLAYQLGYCDEAELAAIGQAGLLHDVGKVRVDPKIIGKRGKLAPRELAHVQQHVVLGCEMVKSAGHFPELVSTVIIQHHERQDGSGYPAGLSGEAIHAISRICAVADSFDAMTSVRPYKDRALTVAEALAILESETPDKYDPTVVKAWTRLVQPDRRESAGDAASGQDRRAYPRHPFRCPARVIALGSAREAAPDLSPLQIITHSLSRGGIGLFSSGPVHRGQRIRVELRIPAAARGHLEGVVVRCRATTEGTFDIGVMFTEESRNLTSVRGGFDDR